MQSKVPINPIAQKKIEEYLYPIYGLYEFWTISPVKIGNTNYIMLSKTYINPNAVPITFFLTTKGREEIMQLAYPLYPTPIKNSPSVAPYSSRPMH